MKIAFIGTRGIPANYSGFETFVEEFASRLAKKGNKVTVYNRSNWIKYKDKTYKGICLVRLPTIPNKHLDTFCHTFISILHMIFNKNKYDIVYICGVGNSVFSFIPRLFGCRVILNVDGLDWKREKWGVIAQLYLKFSEYVATIFPDIVISDSTVIQRYYLKEYSKQTTYIPYGANLSCISGIEVEENGSILKKFGLKKDRYILFVGRLVPENGIHHLIEAYIKLNTDVRLVIVGDAPYSRNYIKFILESANNNPNIIFTGYLFGEEYRQISSQAYLFVLPSRVEATRPVLLEQMAMGKCVLVNDAESNLMTIGEAGFSYNEKAESNGLKDKLEHLIGNPQLRKEYGQKAFERVKKYYTWEIIVESYEGLFLKLIRNENG